MAASDLSPGETLQQLTVRDCLEKAVNRNEQLQIYALEYLASQHRWKAAKGIFEPEWVAGVDANQNHRRNTSQQQVSYGTKESDEQNILYNAGLQFLVPTGAKMNLGVMVKDLSNNIQRQYYNIDQEIESFGGLSLVQPLLRNGWSSVTMAGIRLAAGESQLAFQEYRRQLGLIIGQAEVVYWDLFLAQEQVRVLTNSVRIATTLLEDSRVRLQAGRSSESEVLQADSGLALRLARQKEAERNRLEVMSRLITLVSDASRYEVAEIRAIEPPELREINFNFGTDMTDAINHNPEYLSRHRHVLQESIKVAYARNQTWPQLDLKSSMGLNGLGQTMSTSMEDLTDGNHNNFSIGVELRIPWSGTGVRAKNELEAAKIRRKEALIGLKATETQIATLLENAIRRARNDRQGVSDYTKVVEVSKNLLNTELTRLEAGKSDTRKVLEVEESVAQAELSALENLLDYQKAIIQWELAKGTYLKSRGLEVSKLDLFGKSLDVMKDPGLPIIKQKAAAEFDQLSSDKGAAGRPPARTNSESP